MKLNLTFPQRRALVRAIVRLDSASKQELGRRFAHHLGLIPGPRGPDDGIDGYLPVTGGTIIHFQSKLSSVELDKDDARKYYADIKFHNASSSVMLAGVGYKHTFCQRLFGYSDISNVKVHLLTLETFLVKLKRIGIFWTIFPWFNASWKLNGNSTDGDRRVNRRAT